MSNKKLNVKDRIIKTALKLFYIQGVNNTGINQIIKESKTAKASFYQYFPSKEDLILECLTLYNKDLNVRIKRLMSTAKNYDEFIDAWINAIINDISSNLEFNGCPIANIRFSLMSNNNKEIDNEFINIVDEWINIFDNYLKENNNQLPQDINTKLLARRIIHLYEGAVTLYIMTKKVEAIKDFGILAKTLVKT